MWQLPVMGGAAPVKCRLQNLQGIAMGYQQVGNSVRLVLQFGYQRAGPIHDLTRTFDIVIMVARVQAIQCPDLPIGIVFF
jgi:hypothetical protein